MDPAEWLVIFAVSAAAFFALPHLLSFLSPAARDARMIFSSNVMRIFLVVTWGFVFDWHNRFDVERYTALFILPVIGSWIGLWLWKWSKSELGPMEAGLVGPLRPRFSHALICHD